MSKRYHLRANPLEKYYTKGQCLVDYKYMLNKTINEILEKEPNKEIHILEPSAGLKSLVVEYPNVVWHLYDIDPQSDDIIRADFLTHKFDRRFDIICCNPPFKYKKEFAKKCMALSDNVIFISPANCGLPFYEYSIKKVYSLDFDVRCLIGIWHYNVNKLMRPKWYHKPFKRFAVNKITYDEYLSRADKDKLVVLLSYIDYRSSGTNIEYTVEPPSLYDCYDDIKLERRFIHFSGYKYPDQDDEESWIRRSSNQFILAGTYKEPYYVKLKDGKKREDFFKYMNDNIDEFGYRCIGIDLVNPLCVLPLTDEEYLEWFEPPEKRD